MSAAVFALFHYSLILAPYFFIIGIILAYMYTKTKSIIPPIITHILYNLIVVSAGLFFFRE